MQITASSLVWSQRVCSWGSVCEWFPSVCIHFWFHLISVHIAKLRGWWRWLAVYFVGTSGKWSVFVLQLPAPGWGCLGFVQNSELKKWLAFNLWVGIWIKLATTPSIHPFILLKEVEKIPKSPEDDCVKFLSSVTYGKNIFVSTFYYT